MNWTDTTHWALSDFKKDHQRRAKAQRHWLRRLRKGDVVSACYDGKSGRAVRAVVVKQRKGVVIAEFPRWAGQGVARVRFVNGGGWDAGGETMPLFGVSRRGDWYRLASAANCPPRAGGPSELFVRAVKTDPAATLASVLSGATKSAPGG